jgi:nucleoside phosphorylase
VLLLVPSRLELEKLVPEAAGREQPWPWPGRVDAAGAPVLVATCGVGVALSGPTTLAHLQATGARSLLLAGLAGSFDEASAPVPGLLAGSTVALHGVGVGEGERHRSLADCDGALQDEAESAAGEIALTLPAEWSRHGAPLLTVAAGSATAEDARERRGRYPACVAEDMESWAVARAASLAGVPCTVLRAACNVAGDRVHAGWKVDEAVALLRDALDALTGAQA